MKLALTLLSLGAISTFAFAQDNPYYRAHEWDLDLWGTYAFPDNTGDHIFFQRTFSNDGPDSRPELFPRDAVPKEVFIEAKITGITSNDRFIDRDDAWGGGADVKFFFSKYWGLGVEGFVLDCNTNAGGGGLGTFTFRYPIGQSRFAPYIFAGFGDVAGGGHHEEIFGFVERPQVQDPVHPRQPGREEFSESMNIQNKHSDATGQVGAGLEFRVTPRIGLMSDFAWNAVSGPDNNFGMTRFGVTLSY